MKIKNLDFANFSTDLRRISYWICQGRSDLASSMFRQAKEKYSLPNKLGPFRNIWMEAEKIDDKSRKIIERSDRAATLSSILLQESMK